MNVSICLRRACLARTVLFLVTLSPVVATAAATASAPPGRETDRTASDLKSAVIDVGQRVQRLKNQLLYPPYSRVRLYATLQAPGLVVDHIIYRIDQRNSVKVDLTRRQAVALLNGGFMPLGIDNVTPGPHTIQVSFVSQYAGVPIGTPGYADTGRAVFQKDLRSLSVALKLVANGHGSRPKLHLQTWRPTQ
jgi:hypothetical protein